MRGGARFANQLKCDLKQTMRISQSRLELSLQPTSISAPDWSISTDVTSPMCAAMVLTHRPDDMSQNFTVASLDLANETAGPNRELDGDYCSTAMRHKPEVLFFFERNLVF
jgi:hypothetical protein